MATTARINRAPVHSRPKFIVFTAIFALIAAFSGAPLWVSIAILFAPAVIWTAIIALGLLGAGALATVTAVKYRNEV